MNNENLEITEEINEGICKFFAKGRIDSNSADKLFSRLENAINNGQKAIILNMSMIEYINSIGIRVIMKIFSQAKNEGGTFNIEKPSEIVKDILGMVALKEILVTY